MLHTIHTSYICLAKRMKRGGNQDHGMYGTPGSCRFIANMQLLQDVATRVVPTEEDDEGGEDEEDI